MSVSVSWNAAFMKLAYELMRFTDSSNIGLAKPVRYLTVADAAVAVRSDVGVVVAVVTGCTSMGPSS